MADKSDRSKQEKNKERLTNRQGHPVTQNQNIRTVVIVGQAHWKIMITSKRSVTLTVNGFPSVSYMAEVPVRMAISKHMEKLVMNLHPSTRERNFSKKKVNEPLCLSVFQPSSMVHIHRKHYGTHAALQ